MIRSTSPKDGSYGCVWNGLEDFCFFSYGGLRAVRNFLATEEEYSAKRGHHSLRPCCLSRSPKSIPWDWGQEEKGTTEDEMAGWHHRLDGRKFE